MSASIVSGKHTRVQKVCTLWTHDDNFSKEDVVFNGEKFPELPTSPGTLIQIIALKHAPAVRDFQPPVKSSLKESNPTRNDGSGLPFSEAGTRKSRGGTVRITLDENGSLIQGGRDVDLEKSYIFVVKPGPGDQSKNPNLQISVSEKVAKIFGFRNRMQVVVTEADAETHSASHVEITFRDEYLARADMWQMAISELSNRTVFRGQKLLFMSTIKATIKNVYINGQSKHSGYFSPMTKPIFRSESARYVLFIQMSKEMWDFDTEGAGEIMFNKVVNGFLPDLFKRWMKINARHLVTIILFTRMGYDGDASVVRSDETASTTESDQQPHRFRDYYRVVVSDMASGDWINILYQLKKEFRAFLRDVSLVPSSMRHSPEGKEKDNTNGESDFVISGKPCTASQGNILEAINLASSQFAKDYIDRDLVRTGISVVLITAGTGVFEVDYNMLKLTTDTLIGSGIGIDLVCLSPMPLHSVPLFKYRSPRTRSTMKAAESKCRGPHGAFNDQCDKTPRQHQPVFGSISCASPAFPPTDPPPNPPTPYDDSDEWRYAMPHWVDVSFWSGPSDDIIEITKPKKTTRSKKTTQNKSSSFALRCRMYELQMMGVMENELGGISIPYLEESPLYPHQLSQYSVDSGLIPQVRPQRVKASTTNGSYSSKGDKTAAEKQLDQCEMLHKAWMEVYDDHAFSPIPEKGSRIDQLTLYPQLYTAKEGSPDRFPDENFLSTSFMSGASSFGKTARPPQEGNFHQFMGSQSPRGSIYRPNDARTQPMPRADVLFRQQTSKNMKPILRPSYHQRGHSGDSNDYRKSVYSTPNDSPAVSRGNSPPRGSGLPPLPTSIVASEKTVSIGRPRTWNLLRQLSFGGRGVVAEPSTSAIDITPEKPTVENNQKSAIAAKLVSTRVPEVEIPSQPIAIRPATRPGVILPGLPPEDDVARSSETVKAISHIGPAVSSHPGSVTRDPGSTILLAGSRALVESIGPKLDILSSGGVRDVPRTLSPTSAIAPWTVLVNPCNPRKNTLDVSSQFRRWQHVFPKRLKTASVKWKSLCSPAAVPLTNEYFPSAEQLATEYNESPYKIAQNDDYEVQDAPKSRESLIRELIAFRLSHGFQISIGPAVAGVTGAREQDLSNILHSEYMSHDGDTVFMCMGNTIHQLLCVAGGEVEVKRFNRKPTTALESSAGIDTPLAYRPLIRTEMEDTYQYRDVSLRPARKEFNWNFIDTFLAGYHDEFSEILRFWRARFVLIPVEIPSIHRRPLPPLTEDSEEEIRLEGIRKLTQLWQKNRYFTPEERQFQAPKAKNQKDPNPLAIEYHTRDPSAIVAAGPDSTFLNDFDTEFPTGIFSESDQYQTSNIDIKRLAEDLQGEKGIPMLDRRWHWRLHYNCFLGFDLTNWLLSNFRDVEDRDQAVNLGKKLMEMGLFQHVQKRHQFRDGNFFFQIAADYRAPRPDTRLSWFSMKKAERSVPSTPLSEGPRTSPLTVRSNKSRPNTNDSSSASESFKEGEKTPTLASTPKRKVTLSRVMRYDVDPRNRSYRPEIISLHYDRLHNPDNCYHIRIDWMNVTAKLIEDSIVTWATSVEKYGLKLVEVPIAEASCISDHHPFRTPYIIKLAIKPPTARPEPAWDTAHFSPQSRTDKFAYHKAMLRKLNFVLDVEAASAFPSDVEVTYSWGNPDYKYTQFAHRSGTVLAQITNEGDFLLLANRLAHNRAKDASKFRPTDPYEHKRSTATSTTNPSTPAIDRVIKSPFASPLARPVQDSSLLHTGGPEKSSTITSAINTLRNAESAYQFQTPEQIKDEVEAFCTDPHALKTFYDHAFQQPPNASPRTLPIQVLDHNIPSLPLPPAISIREASPATGGWGGMGMTGGVIPTPKIEAPSTIARRQRSDGSGPVVTVFNTTGCGGGNASGSGPGKRGSVESGSFPARRDSDGSSRTE